MSREDHALKGKLGVRGFYEKAHTRKKKMEKEKMNWRERKSQRVTNPGFAYWQMQGTSRAKPVQYEWRGEQEGRGDKVLQTQRTDLALHNVA